MGKLKQSWNTRLFFIFVPSICHIWLFFSVLQSAFEKSSIKNLAKNEEKLCSTYHKPSSTCHFQKPKPDFGFPSLIDTYIRRCFSTNFNISRRFWNCCLWVIGPLINSFYYNLLIKGPNPWTMATKSSRNVVICQKITSNIHL